jgi:hypothetical protein
METPNQPNDVSAQTTQQSTVAGKTTEAAEYAVGVKLKQEGKGLPADASEAARKGYDDTEGPESIEETLPEGTDDSGNQLLNHRVPVTVNTDRPQPSATPADAMPLNPNADVHIAVDEPGMAYTIEGKGDGLTIDYRNATPEAVIATLIDHLDQPNMGLHARNAAKRLNDALDHLKTGTRDRMRRHGVTAA